MGHTQKTPARATAHHGAAPRGAKQRTWLVGMPSARAILCSSIATSMLPLSE